MGKNTKHMRWWPKPWEYREAEAWLADMAAKGWRLESIGLVFAKFVKAEPAEVRYRCVLHDPSILPGEEDTFIKSYQGVGWKSLGYKKNTRVFSHEEIDPGIDDPTDLSRQEKLARRCVRAKVIWLLISVVVFVAGFCFFALDPARYLNMVLNREIVYSIFVIWFINYWALSIFDLLQYSKSKKCKPKVRPGKFSSAAWVTHIVLLLIIFAPGPNYLIKTFVEKRIVEPQVTIQDFIRVSQAPIHVGDGLRLAKEGYGVFFPYHRIETEFSMDVHQSREADNSGSALFTFAYYQALFGFNARQLGDMLRDHDFFVDTYFKLERPMSLSDREYGFDCLWAVDNQDMDSHIVIAVKGNDVYYCRFEGPVTSDELIVYLQYKAGVDPALNK